MVDLKLVSIESDANKILTWLQSQDILGQYQRPWEWDKNDILNNSKNNIYIILCDSQEVGFAYTLSKRFSMVEIGVTLFPLFRSRGIGITVHQKLIDIINGSYNYIEALTMKENLSEIKVLKSLQFSLVDQFFVHDYLIYKYRKLINSDINEGISSISQL